jgi:hypothetical protein
MGVIPLLYMWPIAAITSIKDMEATTATTDSWITSYKKKTNQKKIPPVDYAFMDIEGVSTTRQYPERLKQFFDFLELPDAGKKESEEMTPDERKAIRRENLNTQGQNFLTLVRQNDGAEWVNSATREYLLFLKERVEKGEIVSGTLRQMWKPIKTFTDSFKDVRAIVDWEMITKRMPRVRGYANDRIPRPEELRKLVEHHDRRIKAIVYTMCSCGMRVGSWEYLQYKHIIPIHDKKTDELKAAKIILRNEKADRDYFSFITPEAFFAIEKWMQFRKSYGETITGESYILRNLPAIAHIKREDDENGRRPKGGMVDKDITKPTTMTRKSIAKLLSRAMYEQGLRNSLEEGKRRYDVKTAHSMRKLFRTKAREVMLRENAEILLDRELEGTDSSYHKPSEETLLAEYLKAVPLLTISESEDIHELKQQQEVLTKKQDQKDAEIEFLRDQLEELQKSYQEQQAKDIELAEMKQAYKDTIEMMQRMQKQVEEQNKKMLEMGDEIHTLGLVAQHYEKIAGEKEQEEEQKS